ncbi:unnamed protein product [Soboliphyme baturini]|uniref:Ras-related protein Rab-18 n=1 Tax=Soboliphyme baturini TaxID=241478 RepID=A0A183IRV7_9BILA|nr:unnamed protein product [Soboliphyme baturini]
MDSNNFQHVRTVAEAPQVLGHTEAWHKISVTVKATALISSFHIANLPYGNTANMDGLTLRVAIHTLIQLVSRCSCCSSFCDFDPRRTILFNRSLYNADRPSVPVRQSSPANAIAHDADAYSLPSHFVRKMPGNCHRLNLCSSPKSPSPSFGRRRATDVITTKTPNSDVFDDDEKQGKEKTAMDEDKGVTENSHLVQYKNLKTEMAEHKKLIKVTDLNYPIDHTFRIMMAGDSAVGKSSIILRMVRDNFSPVMSSTIGVDFQVKILPVDHKWVALQLWDTAGQERYRSLCRSYFRRADAVLMVYDCSNVDSFLNGTTPKGTPIVLCCNKCDLRKDDLSCKFVDVTEGRRLAASINTEYFEVSAKDGTNIQQMGHYLARCLLKKKATDMDSERTILSIESQSRRCLECSDYLEADRQTGRNRSHFGLPSEREELRHCVV